MNDMRTLWHIATTIISFLIYKDWLLPSLQNKDRNSVIALSYSKAELTLRQRIYEECRSIEAAHIDKMKKLITNL